MILVVAIAAGLLGGAIHLVLTAVRARLATRGSPWLALLLAPLGVAAPLLAAGAVLAWRPEQVWAVLVGLFASRFLFQGTVAARLEEGP